MTQEEKQLLLKDLCARLPYGTLVFIRKPFGCVMSETEEELTIDILQEFIENDDMRVLPYLRPISSMTAEEKEDFGVPFTTEGLVTLADTVECMDWLNEHHFDYRSLIEKGLALEAPEGMHKTE